MIDRAARAIAIQIADLSSLLGLERVEIGGSIGLAGGFIDRVHKHLSDEPTLFQPDITAAQLGGDSPLYGALSMQRL